MVGTIYSEGVSVIDVMVSRAIIPEHLSISDNRDKANILQRCFSQAINPRSLSLQFTGMFRSVIKDFIGDNLTCKPHIALPRDNGNYQTFIIIPNLKEPQKHKSFVVNIGENLYASLDNISFGLLSTLIALSEMYLVIHSDHDKDVIMQFYKNLVRFYKEHENLWYGYVSKENEIFSCKKLNKHIVKLHDNRFIEDFEKVVS